MAKFKYTGGNDTGVNAEKATTLYGIHFPVGKAVDVPDDVANKLRTKAGREGDVFEEVGGEKDPDTVQRQKAAKAEAKEAEALNDPKNLKTEDVKELRAKASRVDAETEKQRTDAMLGR